jgi:uncharacterized protein YndB with AHSA1/START domain
MGGKMAVANQEFIITRTFDAPRDIVWKAWTDPKLFSQWFGPKGFTCVIKKQELQPGGIVHSYLKSPDGVEMWGKFVYREIKEPSKLVWVHSFSDEGGVNLTRHPFNPNWPLELLTTVIFEEQGDKTKVTLTWVPINASESERKVFEEGLSSMDQGWGGTFDQFAEFLAKA